MTKYREILRLQSLGFSERNIAQSCGVSRNTVAKVLKKAAEINISWPLDFDMTDSALEELMFPKDKSATNKRMPDFNYIRKELLRNGVNKKLLWVEYCEECRMSNEEPLMYSQFPRLRSPPTFPLLIYSYNSRRFSGTFSGSAALHRTFAFYPAYTYPAGPACHFITHCLAKHKIIRNRQFLIAFCHPCSPLTHLQENKQRQYAEQTFCPSSSPALLYLMG